MNFTEHPYTLLKTVSSVKVSSILGLNSVIGLKFLTPPTRADAREEYLRQINFTLKSYLITDYSLFDN